jgi:hypothetical protein
VDHVDGLLNGTLVPVTFIQTIFTLCCQNYLLKQRPCCIIFLF